MGGGASIRRRSTATTAREVRGLSDDCVIRANPAADGGGLLRGRGHRLRGAAELPFQPHARNRSPRARSSRCPEVMQRAAGAARFASRRGERGSSGATAAAGTGACSPRRDSVQRRHRRRTSSASGSSTPRSRRGLSKLGVHRYEQIAAWMQPDVKRIERGARPRGPHQPGELDRAGAGAGQGRRDALRSRARPAARSPRPRRPPTKASRAPSRGRRCAADAVTPRAVDRRRRRGGRRDRDGRARARQPPPLAVAHSPPTSQGAPPSPRRAGRTLHPRRKPRLPRARNPPCRCGPRRRRHATTCSASAASMPRPRRRSPRRASRRYSQIAHWSPADVARFERSARRERAHRPRELDRAGADPEPRRRHGLLARVRPARARRDRRRVAPRPGSPTPSARIPARPARRRRGRSRSDIGALAIGPLRGLPESGAGPRGRPAHRRAEQGGCARRRSTT